MFGISTTDKISWLGVVFWSFVPLGQLWARIFHFKGSLDKSWLLFPLFLFPPLSFLPMVLLKFNFIKDGQGTNPIDYAMILPILVKFIIPFILPYIIDEDDNETLFSIISNTLQILSIVVAMVIRRQLNCQNITFNSIGKSSIDSITAWGFANFVPFLVSWLPFIGIFTTLMETIFGDFFNDILWSIGFAGSYAIINMLNQENIKTYCDAPFTGYTSDLIKMAIAIVLTIIPNLF